MKKTFAILTIAIIAAACSKEQPCDESLKSTLTIQAGFEQDSDPEVKTYVKDPSAGTIWWGNTDQDRTLFVFDNSNVKNTLTSTSTTAEAVRSFSSDSWTGGSWKYAVWTGYTASKDKCVLNGSVLTGPTLKVTNSQNINNSKSFANTANIAVMNPSDGVLKNVFGYLRFTLPAYPGGSLSAVKSVTLTADENVAGEVQIDCSAAEPVATIVSNGNASKSLTLNTRYKQQGPQGYEGGVVWMILPAGTYHNASLTITPFTSDPVNKDATVGEPFTVKFVGNLVIKRGKYTDCGTLPATDPSPEEPEDPEEPEPEEPGESIVWPNDQAAFDYGLEAGVSKTVAMEGYINYIASETTLTAPITVDKVTFCGNEAAFRNKPCFRTNRAKAFTKIGDVNIPTTETGNFFFKINRPGTISYFPRFNSLTRTHSYVVAIVKVTEDGTSAKYVFKGLPEVKSSAEGDRNKDECRITVNITKDDLKGIKEAATVYVFHVDDGDITQYYPFTWTVAK